MEGAPLLEAQDFPRQTHGQLRPVCGFRPIKTTYAICKHQNSRIVQMISKDCSLPRISPSLFASVMQNRTLWLWGDSLMGELFETVMQCSEKPKKMLPKGVSAGGGAKNHHKWGPIVELSQWFQRSTMDHGGFPAEVDYKCPFTKCIKLQSGTHVCFIRINNPRSHLTEDDGSMPCLRFVRPQDVLLLNAGLGEGRSLFEQWSGHQLHRLAAWKKARDAEGGSPTMIWREFYPQHFGNSPGGHFLGKPQAFKYGCQTKGIDIPEYERLNFRNDRANPVLQEAGYYVLPVWRWSLTIPHLHPLGLDCSHWCQYPGDKLEEEWNLLQMFVTGILAPNMLEGVQTMSTL